MKLFSMEFEIPLVSFIFILFLVINYYSKNRVKFIENKTYEVILITSLIAAFLDTIVHMLSASTTFEVLNNNYFIMVDIINKLISSAFVLIFTCLLAYILLISYEKIRKNVNNLWVCIIIEVVLFFIIISFTHITITEEMFARNTVGFPITFGYIIIAIDLILAFILSIKNFKKNDKRFYTTFIITVMMILLYTLSILFRGLIIYDLILALLCYIMYFTIENPDMKMIKELTNAKENAELSNNNKSAFIFNVVNKMRTPINNFKKIGNQLLTINDIKDVKNGANALIDEVEATEYLINNVLDISSIDVKNIKIFNTKYNFNNLITGIVNNFNIKSKEKEYEFRVNVEENIPNNLFGDSIRLKQIINTILDNSDKYTNKGFIELRISAVTRYEVCRLIIIVEDTGKGMNVTKSNKVFYDYGQEIDLEKIDRENMNLPIVKKLVDMIGGSIMLKSRENKGTEIILTLDQKIVEEEEKNYNIKQTKILYIDDNENVLDEIKKHTKKENITYIYAQGGQTGLEKIRNEEKYDIIMIDSDLEKLSSINTFEKLRKEQGVKIPIMVVTNEGEGKKYKELGFNEYIEKPITKSNVDKILKKYI